MPDATCDGLASGPWRAGAALYARRMLRPTHHLQQPTTSRLLWEAELVCNRSF